MERPVPKPGNLRPDLPDFPPEIEAESETPSSAGSRSAITGWRIAILIWVTAFGFLITFELVSQVFKLLKLRP
jgi:hypothetical protein